MFVTDLITRELPPNRWLVEEPLIYERYMHVKQIPQDIINAVIADYRGIEFIKNFDRDVIGYRITINKNFSTDLASVPRVMRAVFNVNGRTRKPATLHDFLYHHAKLSRAFCDNEFLHAMETCAVNRIESAAMYAGVRAGGWKTYNKYRKQRRSPSCGL